MKCQYKKKIVKGSLIAWQAGAIKDLEGLPYSQIADAIGGITRQVVTNYLTLSNQKTFDVEIIEKINKFRVEHKAKIDSLLV